MPTKDELIRNWIEENKKRKAEGKPSISWNDWYKQKYGEIPEFLKGAEELPEEFQDRPLPIEKSPEPEQRVRARIIKYLDLDSENPNVGTRNKQRLMERALAYMIKWHKGKYHE